MCGLFAYLSAVFLDPAEAEAECARLSEEKWSNGHLRCTLAPGEGMPPRLIIER